ncbi:PGF-CTERM sorting domain-containing protein [Haladaptatus sp. F3-133]|uniref:PGF-CTERM sorting domain-containing protein n=1 Tax=Halorutilus salinus TaxID=2487751 RepID=A0A9Q4C3H4_9EURY|nr:PGF-CTERM sorting domain-containing protein [Halorutilus salinus]MCX2817779.1 PGF-CTERM sorting domain-containing protein [Halorutilus salinus]
MNRKYRITAALLALVVAVSVTALAAPVAAQSVDNVDVTLSDSNGDGLDDAVTVDVSVTDDGAATAVEFGSGTTVDLSATDEGQAPVVSINDNQQNENVTFGSTGYTGTYTVEGTLSGQSDGDSVDVTAWIGAVSQSDADDTATASATVQNTTDGDDGGNGDDGDEVTVTPGDRNQNGPFGTGEIYLGEAGNRPTVFQGESDIQFIAPDGSSIDTLTSTDDQNRVLDVPIGTSEETGAYTIQGTDAADDPGAVVQEPEVTSLEIINVNGEDVSSVTQGNEIAIGVDFNYGNAEPLDPEVLDDEGVDVTGQYVQAGALEGTDGYEDLLGNDSDLEEAQKEKVENEGYDYLISANFGDSGQFEIVAGPDGDGDLADIDSATSTEVLEVASDDDPELELEQDTASQGEEVDVEVTNVEDGDTYYVAIQTDDRRDDNSPVDRYVNDVFVNAGDTENTGVTDDDEYYYAEVEADGTSGLTRIDTEFLDDTSIDIYLYGEGDQDVDYVGDTDFEQDDVSLEVSQAQITVDSPGQTYVPGQEVDLNGTVSEGVDDVAVFIRDRDNYFHVTNISVDDDDDTYEETDFDLSEDSNTQDAADIVGQPGVYRYGVIDLQDVVAAQNDPDSETDRPFVGSNVDANAGLTSSDFSSGASVQQSLRVAEPSLEGAIETYNGEVFASDDVDITGTLIGPREFVTLFTDSRGNTVVNTYNADRDNGEIDEEDITINSLSTGNVRGTILSPGRDTSFGDGTLSIPQSEVPAGLEAPLEGTVDNFVAVANVAGQGRTQSQVTELLLSETVEDAASDDLIVAEEFRLRDDSSTQIEDVVPSQISDNATGIVDIEVGEEMVVRGTTNRNPDDATIVVEATEGPSLAELGTAVTDEWGYDGEWNVTIDVPESVEPGQYTIQSDDGDRISEANVTVAAEGTFEPGERVGDQLGELRNEIEELQSTVDNLESERNDLEEQVTTLEDENSQLEADLEAAQNDTDTGGADDTNETDDGQGQPGFTAVAALISLIAVALLAIRRQEE